MFNYKTKLILSRYIRYISFVGHIFYSAKIKKEKVISKERYIFNQKMSSYLMINEKGPKTHIIEYHPSLTSQITSFMESSTITNNIHDNNSNNNSLFESFIMKEKKELSSSPIIRLRSPRTTSQRREMTLRMV